MDKKSSCRVVQGTTFLHRYPGGWVLDFLEYTKYEPSFFCNEHFIIYHFFFITLTVKTHPFIDDGLSVQNKLERLSVANDSG